MLSSLFVSDLALIRRLSVDFHRGFLVLTGETGAGKSLILDSLNLFLVQKGARDLIRRGAEKMEVSLFFDDLSPWAREELSHLFSQEELDEGITLTRTVTPDGKSVCKVLGRTMPFSQVSEIAKVLFAIHGQGASGGLMDEKNHRIYLDGALPEDKKALPDQYRALYRDFVALKQKLSQWEADRGDEKEKIALYDFQLKEIAKVRPRAGEEEELEEELKKLQSYEKTYSLLSTSHRALSGGEKGKGASFLLEAAAARLESLGEESEFSASAKTLFDLALRAREIEKDLSFALSELGEGDPAERVDQIQRRLDALYKLKLKYGGSIEEVIAYFEKIKEKKLLTLSLKDDIKKGREELNSLEKRLLETGRELTLARRRVADALEDQIHKTLAFLDMPKMRFFVEMEEKGPGPDGMESVRFAISPNTGEGKKPLAQVASGGELSRIMLALQLKLGHASDADTLVFDEVDTGISGATSQKIGIALKNLAQNKQIICVTHSAQVASLASHHFLVEKREEEGRTETGLTPLTEEEALLENARLLGGKVIGAEARQAALALKNEGEREWNKWKNTVL